MNFFEKFGKSALELKSLKCITITGILIALDLVLKLVSIKISADLKITFAYLALATIGMLFGPTVSFLAGVITDVLGFLLSPEGGFSPLFTLIEAIGAMIYGIFLYDIKPLKLKDSIISKEKYSFSAVNILKSIGIGAGAAALFALIMVALNGYFSQYVGSEESIGKLAKVFTDVSLIYIAAGVGFLYGVFFGIIIFGGKKDKTGLKKSISVILSKVIVVIVCNLILTPIAFVYSGYMTADSVIASYPVRLAKNAIQCPVDCLILLIILFPILAAYQRIFPNKKGKTKDKNINTESVVTDD